MPSLKPGRIPIFGALQNIAEATGPDAAVTTTDQIWDENVGVLQSWISNARDSITRLKRENDYNTVAVLTTRDPSQFNNALRSNDSCALSLTLYSKEGYDYIKNMLTGGTVITNSVIENIPSETKQISELMTTKVQTVLVPYFDGSDTIYKSVTATKSQYNYAESQALFEFVLPYENRIDLYVTASGSLSRTGDITGQMTSRKYGIIVK